MQKRVWAACSLVATKEVLNARDYRWSGRRPCWYSNVEEDRHVNELPLLNQEIFHGEVFDLPVERIPARNISLFGQTQRTEGEPKRQGNVGSRCSTETAAWIDNGF